MKLYPGTPENMTMLSQAQWKEGFNGYPSYDTGFPRILQEVTWLEADSDLSSALVEAFKAFHHRVGGRSENHKRLEKPVKLWLP